MKNIAVFLLCLSMLSASAVVAHAEEAETNTAPGEATIGTEVPDSHKIIITVEGNVDFTVNGETGTEFEVERLSQPVIEIKAKDGEKITKVTINGEDITDQLVDGKYTLPPVYEDGEYEIVVETEEVPADSSGPDSSTPDSSESDSSTPDSSESDSSSSKSDNSSSSSSSSSSQSSSSQSSSQGGGKDGSSPSDANPATGIIGGATVGGGLILGALLVTKRKSKESEEE